MKAVVMGVFWSGALEVWKDIGNDLREVIVAAHQSEKGY